MWILCNIVLERIQNVLLNVSESQIQAFASESGSRNSVGLDISNSVATISIEGVMTEKPDFMAFLFGGGNPLYSDIESTLAVAEADSSVKSIVLDVNSPGGTVDGLFKTLDAISATKKPIESRVGSMAASAAYAIVSATDNIVATSKAASFGSIGVVQTFHISENEHDVTSTHAPKKRPDASTEDGRADIRETLDEVHDLFVGAIAHGRRVSSDEINADFGQGATFLAGKALEAGMIDAIEASEAPVPKSKKATSVAKTEATKVATTEGVSKMDLAQLKAEHPALYKELFDSGHEAGVACERDRVGAHAVAGKASGDTGYALSCIADGTPWNSVAQATHQMGTANLASIAATAADAEETSGDLEASSAEENSEEDDVTAVLAAATANLGL